MATALRDGLHVALNRPRVFVFAGATLLLEGLGRLALAVVHPLLAVVCPPVVALPLLGAAAPTVRTAVITPDAPPKWTIRATLRERGLQLLAAAIGGHLVALALGASAFLLVDTPIRLAVYATGGSVSKATVHVAPLAGVAAGTLVAWGLLAPAVERVVAGNGIRDAAVAPLHALGDRRRTASALGLHVMCVLVAAGVFAVCLGLASERYATRDATLLALFTMVTIVVASLALLGVFVYPIHVALSVSDRGGTHTIPVRRVALAALVVAGLVVGAGAVRVTETRPTAATGSPSLPEDVTGAYAVAIDRTLAADHRIVAAESHGGEQVVATTVVDHSSRQVRTSLRHDDQRHVGYADSGVVYGLRGYSPDLFSLGERRVDGARARALPGYWQASDDYTATGAGGYELPEARTGTWTTLETANGTRTVELTGGAAVFDALQDAHAEKVSAETAWVRMRIDTDRGVVLGGRARLNATVNGHRHVRNVSYSVRTGDGVDASRPDALGSRSPGEWVWDVFAY